MHDDPSGTVHAEASQQTCPQVFAPMHVMLHVPCAAHVTSPPQFIAWVQAMLQLAAVQVTSLPQAPGPEHAMVHEPVESHVTSPAHAPGPEHSTVQEDPPVHVTSPLHACAAEQSTVQGNPGGQATLQGAFGPPSLGGVHPTVHVPPSHVPPASAQAGPAESGLPPSPPSRG
jgi:hypothetical protein